MGRFHSALKRPDLAAAGLAAIAEIKRRSPSAGELRVDLDPAALARAYAEHGAAAVSILVDERFAGSFEDIRAARSRTDVPILAKGFFTGRDQLVEAHEAGADAALLILRDLDDAQAQAMLGWAAELGLDTLVEAHTEEELERALALAAPVIGVNARDLTSFAIDRRAQLELLSRIPKDRVAVAESGIWSRAQAAAAELAGADAFLVGSALMRAPRPEAKLAELLSRPLVKVCGLTRQEDVAAACEAGADLAGFVLTESPRRVDAPLEVPETMLSVAVAVGSPIEESRVDLVQLYPEENGHRGREATLLRGSSEVARVLDLPWEGDDPAHWDRAARREGRVVLAGGLSPENVGEAIRRVRPWAVDASRSLETAPGIKDHARIRAFVEAARAAGAST